MSERRKPRTTPGIQEFSIDIDGVHSRCFTAGSGPPVILLHGVGDSAFDWKWVISGLSSEYLVLAPDLPCTTGIDGANNNYSLEFNTLFLEKFLRNFDIEEAVFVGHSMGGQDALNMAFMKPSSVRALVLVGSAGLGRAITPVMRMIVMPGIGEFVMHFGKTPIGAVHYANLQSCLEFHDLMRVPYEWYREEYELSQQPRFLTATIESMRTGVDPGGQHILFTDRLPELVIPTLIVWGEQDMIVPVEQGCNAQRLIPDSRLEIFPACGHVPHMEKPVQFTGVIKSFLSGEDFS